MDNDSSYKDILDILACPKCRGSLGIVENRTGSGLECAACAVVYPVREGIPVLLVEEALPRQDWDKGGDAAG